MKNIYAAKNFYYQKNYLSLFVGYFGLLFYKIMYLFYLIVADG